MLISKRALLPIRIPATAIFLVGLPTSIAKITVRCSMTLATQGNQVVQLVVSECAAESDVVTTEKSAVFAPIPRARVRIATEVKPGDLRSTREA